MKLEQSFEVAAPLDRVWAALIDVERVAPCLPGADISGRNEDGSYNGSFRVKIGPTAAAYVGKLEMEKIDEIGRTATMQAQGTDRRGQGGAKATIFSAVKEAAPGTTLVEVITEYHITGRLARFGRGGMIDEISTRLLREFAQSLQDMLAAPAEEGAYETFVGMSAVKPDAPAAESPASESRTKEPAEEEKPKRRQRRDLAAAADAVAAASQPPTAPEPAAVEPEAVQAAAEDELAAVVPEASEEAEPPVAEEPARPVPEPPVAEEPARPVPEPPVAEAPAAPVPEPEVPEPAPVPEPEVPEVPEPSPPPPPPTPEPPAPPAPPAPEPPPPPAAPEPPPPPPPPSAEGAAEGPPLDGIALARTALVDRIKSNPAPLVALLLALLLLGWRRRRR